MDAAVVAMRVELQSLWGKVVVIERKGVGETPWINTDDCSPLG